MEGLVNPRTGGSLEVQQQEIHVCSVATLSEIEGILNVNNAFNKRNYMIVEGPLLLQCPVAHD